MGTAQRARLGSQQSASAHGNMLWLSAVLVLPCDVLVDRVVISWYIFSACKQGNTDNTPAFYVRDFVTCMLAIERSGVFPEEVGYASGLMLLLRVRRVCSWIASVVRLEVGSLSRGTGLGLWIVLGACRYTHATSMSLSAKLILSRSHTGRSTIFTFFPF